MALTGRAGTDRPVTDVLVLRALGLGDLLASVAALRGVRRAWPRARVTLAAPAAPAGWLRGLGVVDRVLPVDGLRAPPALPVAGPPDVAVDLHGRGPRSHDRLQETTPARLVAYAAPGHPDGPAWDPDEHEVLRWVRLVRSAGGGCSLDDLRLPRPTATHRPWVAPGRGEVVVHPGAASGSRRWPAERWTAVVRALTGAGHFVELTGSRAERALCARVVAGLRSEAELLRVRDRSGQLDLPGLAAAVASAHLVVCGDTGVAHLATALATPSVLLFGPVDPGRWGPLLDVERHTVLWHGARTGPGDPHGDALDPALARIGVDEVVAAALAQLALGPTSLTPAREPAPGTTRRSA